MSPRLAWLVKAVLARGSTLLGIEGNTALVRYDNACRAAGTGGVTVWSRRLKKRYTNGETVEWP
jgi:cyanophycinase-like exopeptidase